MTAAQAEGSKSTARVWAWAWRLFRLLLLLRRLLGTGPLWVSVVWVGVQRSQIPHQLYVLPSLCFWVGWSPVGAIFFQFVDEELLLLRLLLVRAFRPPWLPLPSRPPRLDRCWELDWELERRLEFCPEFYLEERWGQSLAQ